MCQRTTAGRCRDARRNRARQGIPERDGHRERAAATWSAFDRDPASHQFHKLFRNRESQPRSTEFPDNRSVGLAKRLEDLQILIGGNANASILDLKVQRLALAFSSTDGYADGPAFGK